MDKDSSGQIDFAEFIQLVYLMGLAYNRNIRKLRKESLAETPDTTPSIVLAHGFGSAEHFLTNYMAGEAIPEENSPCASEVEDNCDEHSVAKQVPRVLSMADAKALSLLQGDSQTYSGEMTEILAPGDKALGNVDQLDECNGSDVSEMSTGGDHMEALPSGSMCQPQRLQPTYDVVDGVTEVDSRDSNVKKELPNAKEKASVKLQGSNVDRDALQCKDEDDIARDDGSVHSFGSSAMGDKRNVAVRLTPLGPAKSCDKKENMTGVGTLLCP